MTIKRVSENAYDVEGNGSDFHISKQDDGSWAVDEFNSSVKDADKAHIDSNSFDSFQEALDSVLEITPDEARNLQQNPR